MVRETKNDIAASVAYAEAVAADEALGVKRLLEAETARAKKEEAAAATVASDASAAVAKERLRAIASEKSLASDILKEENTRKTEVDELKALAADKQSALTPAQLAKIENALTDPSAFDRAGAANEERVRAEGEEEKLRAAIAAIKTFKVVSVDALPASGEEKTIYLVPSAKSAEKNVKDEYLWIDGKWEQIGSTAVDLKGYVKSVNEKSGEVVLTGDDIKVSSSDSETIADAVENIARTANEKYTKPSGGIPSTDIALGVIPDLTKVQTLRINDEWRFSVAPGLSGGMAIRLEHLDFPAQGIWGVQTEMTIPTGLGTLARSADITDATKLTPVFSEWMLGDHSSGMLIRNISATYNDDKKGWDTSEELSSDGGKTWTTYTVGAEQNPDPDGTATSVTCISSTFVRVVVGYKLGPDSDAPILIEATEKTDEQGEKTHELPEPIKTALFSDDYFKEVVDKEIEEHGGIGFKHDEHGYYIDVEQEA